MNTVIEKTPLYELAHAIAVVKEKMKRAKETKEYAALKENLASYQAKYQAKEKEWIGTLQGAWVGNKQVDGATHHHAGDQIKRLLSGAEEHAKGFSDEGLRMAVSKADREILKAQPKTMEEMIADGVKKGIEATLGKAVDEEIKKRKELAELQNKLSELQSDLPTPDVSAALSKEKSRTTEVADIESRINELTGSV